MKFEEILCGARGDAGVYGNRSCDNSLSDYLGDTADAGKDIWEITIGPFRSMYHRNIKDIQVQ